MRRTIVVVGIFLAVVLPAAPANAVTITKNVTYKQVGGIDVKLDVFMPDAAGPFPGLVFIHGGQFYRGDKCQSKYVAQARHFASAGFVVYNIDYRLAPNLGNHSTVYTCSDGTTTDVSYLQGNLYPAGPNDVTTAVQWISNNGAGYKTDTSHISCVGESAGGNLCYTLGTSHAVNVEAGWSGSTKLDENYAPQVSNNYIGCLQTACPEKWMAASPYYAVTSTSAPAAIYNSSNEIIPQSQADMFDTKLKEYGVLEQETILSGSKHAVAYANTVLPNGKTVWRDTADFIKSHV